MVSIAVPVHDMEGRDFFLRRLLDSVESQTYKDYEIIVTEDGKMAENTNSALSKASGEIIKLIQMDDFFAHPGALREIVDNFTPQDHWMMTAYAHTTDGENRVYPHYPKWNDKIWTGSNTLGGLSALVVRNDPPLMLEEPLTWVVDCDLYQRYYDLYGLPKILNSITMVIQWGDHQVTRNLTDETKQREVEYLISKYDKRGIRGE
jgi:glycosyltransferase involved in cell wall biosynthesis